MLAWFRRSRQQRDDDIERELRAHVNLEKEEQQERGRSALEARYAAQRALGNITRLKEDLRASSRHAGWDILMQDFAHAFRLLRRAPAFSALVLLTLTLGIGTNTAVFSILNGVLLQPLPYAAPSRLVVIWDRQIHEKGTSKIFALYSDYENWKGNSRQFEDVAAVSWARQASPGKILSGHGPARSVFALPVTSNFFDFLGVPAVRGRTFTATDAGRACKVVLAYRFWQTAFGGLDSTVGSPIRLDDQVCMVAGVMPPNFDFLPPGVTVNMWTILPKPEKPDDFSLVVLARLRPHVAMSSAQAETSLLHHRLHKNDTWGARMEPVLYDLHEEFTWLTGRNLRLSLYVLFAAVSFVLVICCVNVANLLLARAVVRDREMAIRAALGSGPPRLLRQLLTESLLLSLLASVAGAILAAAIVHYAGVSRPIDLPPGVTIQLSAPVLAFAVLLSIVTCLLFGLVPAWRASRADLQIVLKSGGRSSSQGTRQQRLGKYLIVAEVTLTTVLLAGAGLLIETVQSFTSAPLGFQPNGLVTTRITLPPIGYTASERRRQFLERLQTDLAAIPGVDSVALSNSRPIEGGGIVNVIMVEGHQEPHIDQPADTFSHTVSANYFQVLQIPLEIGRFFDSRDSVASEPTVIINEALAREYLSGENAVGKHIRVFGESESKSPWLRVVGLVRDEKRTSVYQEMAWADQPIMYRPLAQDPLMSLNAIARVSAAAGRSKLSTEMQQAIAAIDPNVPADPLLTVSELESQATAYPRFRAILLTSFAVAALLLATIGLFGVLSHSVAQRRHEIGVRMALGAEKSTVVLMILKEGFLLTCAGILLGTAASWALDRYLSALLYGVRLDPLLFAVTAFVLLSAAFCAIYLPLRRAAKVDPMIALRYE